MRILLKTTAFATLLCTALIIASLGNVSTSETIALGSSKTTQKQQTDRAVSENRRGIQTAKLVNGQGIVRTPQPGYLIVTSESSTSLSTTVHISNQESPGTDVIEWRPLIPLTVVHSDNRLLTNRQPARRTSDNTRRTDQNNDSTTIRTFYLHVTNGSLSDPRQYVPVQSRPIAEGKLVRVYLDQQRKVTPRIQNSAQQIIKTLEEQIIPRANREVGPWDDVDGDGRLSVLLTPWLEKLQGGQTSLKGFVRGSDFQPRYPAPFGNQADLIYFNSELAADVDLVTLLAHEYWHILQCSYRLSMPEAPLATEEDWISEGTAHLAEIRFGGGPENLAHRIDTWLAAPESAPLIVENYYSAGLWRDDGCRGATFLFFHWCARQFGSDLAKRLLTSPGSGARNLRQVTGNDLATLQTHWTVTMLEQCCLTERAPQAKDGRALFAETRALQKVRLDRLRVHSTNRDSKDGVRFELAPTATCFVRVEPGRWEIEAENKASVPLRITFVPETSTERLADSTKAAEPTGLR